MKESVEITAWSLAIIPNKTVALEGINYKTAAEVLNNPYGVIPAEVPGNFELDMMREGLLPDLYYADNILKAQELENRHLWYAAEFTTSPRPGCDTFLTLEGIDTAAEIFLDGELIGTSEDMFLPFTYKLSDTAPEKHGLAVHIIPALIYARRFTLPASCDPHPFNGDSLKIRKAPYMFGWDIMPRIVSAGLWKPVHTDYLPKDRIENVFLYTRSLDSRSADMKIYCSFTLDGDFAHDYSFRAECRCRDSRVVFGRPVMSADVLEGFAIPEPYLWYPKNYGEQNLYDVTVTLLKGNAVCDSVKFRTGIRIAEIERTSLAGDGGEFVIKVNDKKIFCMGSNLVPTDAFPSRMREYTKRQCDMLEDLGCNIVRCWGGNVYPDDELYDFCDEHGILVWQDFAMACGRFPEDERMRGLIEREVTHIVKKFRNHPSLAVWAGDNECDCRQPAQYINGRRVNAVDPNTNMLTRGVIPYVLRNEDHTRPYLPSSPYVDSYAFEHDLSGREQQSEQHLWGPRDFFKGDFYVNSTAHFASETGYHGCPSPDSIKRFISPGAIDRMGNGERSDDPEWMLHSSTFRTDRYAPYNYRTSLMIRQAERLFLNAECGMRNAEFAGNESSSVQKDKTRQSAGPNGSGYVDENNTAFRIPNSELENFVLRSQISQAEAKKFFIEHFRCGKWRRTGIIWWNLIDGWPQVSDAVVDWYGVKKLAYSYIKRSQAPFLMMFDEPVDGKIMLKAANDLQKTITVSYSVTNLTDGRQQISGTCMAEPNTVIPVTEITEEKNAFYLIEWSGGAEGVNHYAADIYHGLDFDLYVSNMKKAGFYQALEF